MSGYISRLAERIRRGSTGSSAELFLAEYVSPSSIRIGGELFSHDVSINPDLLLSCEYGKRAVSAGDTVLAAMIGNSFYVICRL